MTTSKLILFRLAILLIGPWQSGSRFLRFVLMKAVRRKGKMTYVAHADFLDVRQMTTDSQTLPVTPPR